MSGGIGPDRRRRQAPDRAAVGLDLPGHRRQYRPGRSGSFTLDVPCPGPVYDIPPPGHDQGYRRTAACRRATSSGGTRASPSCSASPSRAPRAPTQGGSMSDPIDRRSFLARGAAAGAGIAVSPPRGELLAACGSGSGSSSTTAGASPGPTPTACPRRAPNGWDTDLRVDAEEKGVLPHPGHLRRGRDPLRPARSSTRS